MKYRAPGASRGEKGIAIRREVSCVYRACHEPAALMTLATETCLSSNLAANPAASVDRLACCQTCFIGQIVTRYAEWRRSVCWRPVHHRDGEAGLRIVDGAYHAGGVIVPCAGATPSSSSTRRRRRPRHRPLGVARSLMVNRWRGGIITRRLVKWHGENEAIANPQKKPIRSGGRRFEKKAIERRPAFSWP